MFKLTVIIGPSKSGLTTIKECLKKKGSKELDPAHLNPVSFDKILEAFSSSEIFIEIKEPIPHFILEKADRVIKINVLNNKTA